MSSLKTLQLWKLAFKQRGRGVTDQATTLGKELRILRKMLDQLHIHPLLADAQLLGTA